MVSVRLWLNATIAIIFTERWIISGLSNAGVTSEASPSRAQSKNQIQGWEMNYCCHLYLTDVSLAGKCLSLQLYCKGFISWHMLMIC